MLEIIANDNAIIPYRKDLNDITGCVTASILLSQMLYWWKYSGGEFYKFKEPCKHEKYNEGDSWCEELGYSKKQFDGAFKRLEDAGFASKRITIDRLTYYSINEENLRKALNGIYVSDKRGFTKSTKGDLVYIGTETTTEITTNKKNNIKKSLNDRRNDFYERIAKLNGKYAKQTLRDFFDHWTTVSDNGTKMAFEKCKTWNTEKRLATWAKNDYNGTEKADMKKIMDELSFL